MIDYQTFCQLRQLYDEKGLKISQIAAVLQLDLKTVEKWVDQPTYHPRQGTKRASKLDSFKGQIAALLERHPYTAQLHFYSDSVIQFSSDLLSMVRMIQGGVDVEEDGTVDLDASRIYFVGQSFGTLTGMPVVAYTDAIRASEFIVPFSAPGEQLRLSPGNRPALGTGLGSRTPSLLNSAYGLTSLGGVTVASPFFNENIPLRDQAPLVDTIP